MVMNLRRKMLMSVWNYVFPRLCSRCTINQTSIPNHAIQLKNGRQFCQLYRKTNNHGLQKYLSSMLLTTYYNLQYSTEESNSGARDEISNRNMNMEISPHQKTMTETPSITKVLTLDDVHELLQELNGEDIVVLELSKELNYVDYFVVVTAKSPRHLMYMSQTLNQLYKAKKSDKDPFLYIEGKKDSSSWQCIDMSHIVVHFMLSDLRKRYQLEKLWLLGPQYDDLWHESPEETDPFSLLDVDEVDLLETQTDNNEKQFVAPWETSYGPAQTLPEDFDEDDYVI